jgi:hypothetical protein
MDVSALLDGIAQHQTTLTWIAGGVATAAGGLWVVIRYVLDRSKADSPSAASRKPVAPTVSAVGGVAAGRDMPVGRDVNVHHNRIPKAAFGLAALGLLLLGYALLNSGSHISAQNSAVNTGTMSNSRQEVSPSGPASRPSQ